MENRKFIALVPAIALGLFIIGLNTLAYDQETHSFLTSEATKVFNKNSSSELDDNLINYLIDGSRREDDPPRWMNHFYDPEFQRGLSFEPAIDPTINLGNWQSSKEWAVDSSNQNKASYSPVIATILSSIQSGRIQKFFPTSDFTWKEAINYWINGEGEMAMFSLGHVIHLIQDASVPDHTRNDAHPGDSPYENYSSQFNLSNPDINLQNKKITPVNLGSLADYFDGMAIYSNNNFYSKDTIGIQSGYKLPEVDEYLIEKDYSYGIKSIDGNKYEIFLKRKGGLFDNVVTSKNDASIFLNKFGGEKIVGNYWSLLSKKSVEYSSGVIDLFFKEVEKAKNDPSLLVKKEKGFLAQVTETISGIGSKINGAFSFVKESLYGSLGIKQVNQISEVSKRTEEEENNPTDNEVADKEDLVKEMVINNTDTFRVSRVIDGDTIALENGTILRYIGIDAPEISYKEENSECFAVEAMNKNKSLVAGKLIHIEYGPEKMDKYDRILAYVWVDNILINKILVEEGYAYAFNFGQTHPKDNEFSLSQERAKSLKKGLWSKPCSKNEEIEKEDDKKNENNQKQSQNKFCDYNQGGQPTFQGLTFNEVAWMGTETSSNDEWLEIRNNSNITIDPTGWQIISQDENIQIDLGKLKTKSIAPQNFLLLERTDDSSVPTIIADIIYSGSLSNSNEELKIFDPSCQTIDFVSAKSAWSAGDNSSKRTMERNYSDLGWHTSSIVGGTPKAENSSAYSVVSSNNYSQNQSNNQQSGSSTSTAETPKFYPVIINEIMYDPQNNDTDREWIEIFNSGTTTLDLTNWKLNENDADHSLASFQGGMDLAVAGYAIIVDNPEKFKLDFPSYVGVIIDSSFSLNNSGEKIQIKNKTLLIDEITYAPQESASNSGKSLQLIDGAWKAANPTPGSLNQKDSLPIVNSPPANHIVISEIQISGDNPDDEFIEIYNPTDSIYLLSDWSIQYISGRATSTLNVYKKNFEAENIIAPKSFFLLANKNGRYSQLADMTYGFSLSGESSGGIIVITATTTELSSLADFSIQDWVAYGAPNINPTNSAEAPDPNKSIERKTISDSQCQSSQKDNEFKGNSCDINHNGNDFDIREMPNPQKSNNFPEPRITPTAIADFQTSYNQSKIGIDFSYSTSTDFRGTSTDIIYKIFGTKSDSEKTLLSSSSSTLQQIKIDKINQDYSFDIVAYDKEGLPSATTTSTVFAPGLITSLYAYRDPREPTEYSAEIYYQENKFIPDLYYSPENSTWKLIILYLNSSPEKDSDIFETWLPIDSSKTLSLRYEACASISNQSNYLLIPDAENMCSTSGGAYNNSLKYQQLEDNHLLFKIHPEINPSFDSNNLQSNYVTIALYSTSQLNQSNGTIPYFKLVAIDNKKYYFINLDNEKEDQIHQSPILTGNIEFNFTPANSNLQISWLPASDQDSLDDTLQYEIKYGLDGAWEDLQKSNQTNKIVSPQDKLEIKIRARDNFGNYSNEISGNWEYPQVVEGINQNQYDNWLVFGTKNPNFPSGPDSASLQAIIPNQDTQINKITTKLTQSTYSDLSDLRLSVYESGADNKPDYSLKIAESQILGALNRDVPTDMTFDFSPSFTMTGGKTYWLVLDVSEYSDSRGFYRNEWKNAVYNAEDLLPNGSSGTGPAGPCEITNMFCPKFEFPFPNPNSDWYIKISFDPNT